MESTAHLAMATKKNTAETKDRIFRTAVQLFARKGFAATGMRELAAKAEVNLATIHYFFGSKYGLLEAVLSDLFEGIQEIMLDNLSGPDPPIERLQRYIRATTGYMVKKHDQALLAITQLPLDEPQIKAFKAEWAKKLMEIFRSTIQNDLEAEPGRPFPIMILWPALAGLILSHFMFRPLAEMIGGRPVDEAFYQAYPDLIVDMATNGLLGPAKRPLTNLDSPIPGDET